MPSAFWVVEFPIGISWPLDKIDLFHFLKKIEGWGHRLHSTKKRYVDADVPIVVMVVGFLSL